MTPAALQAKRRDRASTKLAYIAGIAAFVTPFALSSWKKNPAATVARIGLGVVAASLFVAFRAARAARRIPSPETRAMPQRRVTETQRPLEGLSAPSYY